MSAMNQTSSLLAFSKLLDLLPTLDASAKNVVLLGGTGGGWVPRLAYSPSAKINLKDSEATPQKLIDFISNNRGKLIIGFISYDFGYRLQQLKTINREDTDLMPDIYFLAYDNYLEGIGDRIKNYGIGIPVSENGPPANGELLSRGFSETLGRAEYGELFNKTMDYIKSGHVYQLNLSHRLQARSKQNPRLLFSQIAKNNQAPMMGYMESENFELLSLSPERFVSIDGGLIKTTPIKGTRALENNNLAEEKLLLEDPKEKSELSMITDLLRNDLAKVSDTGSVKVINRRATQTLTSVVHTYSEISSKLKDGIAPIEALISMLPGGSITGCPKLRAMQIIDELEPHARGVYCGSMVCIDPDGSLDSNILIRTIVKKDQRLTLQIGGGIVFDSDKDSEYQETLDKAKSIISSLKS